MAASDDSSDSVGSWAGFIAQLNSTFDLLRDLFGYGMPGGVFIATGLVSQRIRLSMVADLLHPYHPPTWVLAILAVVACYIVGDVLAALAYLPNALLKWAIWEGGRIRRGILKPCLRRWKDTKHGEVLASVDRYLTAWAGPWLAENPTEVSAALVRARSRHPKLLNTLDRRETLTILAGSTSVALLGGWFVFFWKKWDAKTLLCWAGALVLLQFATGISHLRRVRTAILDADAALAREEKPKSPPDFNQAIADIAKAVDGLATAVRTAAAAGK